MAWRRYVITDEIMAIVYRKAQLNDNEMTSAQP
jgi:hypothetical protein